MKWTIDTAQKAWHLATKMHDGQKYGGSLPGEQIDYLNHIGGVVFEILAASQAESDMDIDLAVLCAILHDTLEDTSLEYAVIETQFGSRVAQGVLALTKNTQLEGKRAQMLDSLARIRRQAREVWMVKMADRIVNLYAPPHYWTDQKKQEYMDEALLILNELTASSAYLSERLRCKIEAYQQFIVVPT